MTSRTLDRLRTRLINPAVARLPRTPPHDLLSRSIAPLTVTGRRSGAAVQLPVRYEQEGATLTVAFAPHRLWWRNLRGGAPVWLALAGVARDGHATVHEGANPVVTIRLIPRARACGGAGSGPSHWGRSPDSRCPRWWRPSRSAPGRSPRRR